MSNLSSELDALGQKIWKVSSQTVDILKSKNTSEQIKIEAYKRILIEQLNGVGLQFTVEGDLIIIKVDQSVAMAAKDFGGIDFNPDKLNLQIQNSTGEIKFNIDPAMLQQLQHVPGFIPEIINIQPMADLRQFLGLTVQEGRL